MQDRALLNDPSIVRWSAKFYDTVRGSYDISKIVPLRPCTDEDFDKFYPPEDSQVERFENYRKGGGLFCLDWAAIEFELNGLEYMSRYTAIDIEATPCQTYVRAIGETLPEPVKCNNNQTLAKEYIDSSKIIVVYNKGTAELSDYDNPVRLMSEMAETQFDNSLPNFVPMYIEQAKFDDESDFIQYGQFDEYDYIEMDLTSPRPSMYNNWPSDYKFTGIELWYGVDLKKRTRQSYSLQ